MTNLGLCRYCTPIYYSCQRFEDNMSTFLDHPKRNAVNLGRSEKIIKI